MIVSAKQARNAPFKVLSSEMDPVEIRLIRYIFIKGSLAEAFIKTISTEKCKVDLTLFHTSCLGLERVSFKRDEDEVYDYKRYNVYSEREGAMRVIAKRERVRFKRD